MESILATQSSADQTPRVGELALGVSPTAPCVSSRNLVTVHCPTPTASFESVNVITLTLASATHVLTL